MPTSWPELTTGRQVNSLAARQGKTLSGLRGRLTSLSVFPAVELRFVDGTRGGQVISRSVPNSNSYAVGEQFDMTYQVGRLTGNVIVKDLEE